MKIVQIASEFAPIAKAGGLGEVVLGLSRELTRQHHQVDVILPKYSFIDPSKLTELAVEPTGGPNASNTIWSAAVEECRLHLIEPREEDYFRRSQIYGFPDDAPRFLHFCKAAMEYLAALKKPIDILHLHDWHAAACAPLLRGMFASKIRVGKVIFTIHNLEYQGKCGTRDLDAIGMKGAAYLTPGRLQDTNPLYPQSINLLKGGILYSDAVNTVSPSYAQEIQEPSMGFGLDQFLKRAKVKGILNGVDQTVWNPAKDPHLAVRYHSSDPLAKIREAKNANKRLLQEKFKLKSLGRPLVGAITRLVPQKGIYLIQAAIEAVLDAGGAFALMGSSSSSAIQHQFDELKKRYKNHPHVFLEYRYSDPLAHLLYAALDFVLVPSLFEPCGLTQIIAMHYGTIPIVRSTGGLRDTVFDCEDGMVPLEKRNGFVFKEPTVEALRTTLQRAFSFWHAEQPTCLAMLRRMMETDCSWRKPAQEYLKLYLKSSPANKPAAPAKITISTETHSKIGYRTG